MTACRIAAVLAAAALLSATSARAADLSGIAEVIDGDSLRVGANEVRLAGVDAPEWSQECKVGRATWRAGQEAAAWLKSRIEGRPVYCAVSAVDRYQRKVATCFVEGVDINAELVAAGWAVAYRKYSARYIPQEEAAKAAALGIWRGRCDLPSEWRTNHHERTQK